MATPINKDTANTNAHTARDAIESASDQAFIDDAAAGILEAVAQGKFKLTLTTGPDCNTQVIHDYFISLGYTVAYPGQNMLPGCSNVGCAGGCGQGCHICQPAELFGPFWELFWENGIPPMKGPVRLILFWVVP